MAYLTCLLRQIDLSNCVDPDQMPQYTTHPAVFDSAIGCDIQTTVVISKSEGRSETLRDIITSTYQICGTEKNN